MKKLLLALCMVLVGQAVSVVDYASASTVVQSMNSASGWHFTSAYGVSDPISNPNGGWSFDFPVYNRPIADCYADKQCPYVGYLMYNNFKSVTADALTMTVQVTATGNPVFNYQTEPFNTCATPAKARFIIQSVFDNGTYEYDRWWSEPVALELKPGQPVTITVPIKPENWISVLGKRGSQDATSAAAFYDTMKWAGAEGITFGGGCFFGHGVNIAGGSGTAKFNVTNYAFVNTSLPKYTAASIQNSASATGNVVGDGWATVYGTDLISDVSCPSPTSLVTELCGTQVKVNGTPTILNYAGKNQINFLMPNVYGQASVEVISRDGSGGSVSITSQESTMDLFSQTSDGKGLVAAQHWTTPGIPLGTLVSTQYPARQEYPLVIYAAGLGQYGNMNNKPTVKINGKAVSSNYISYVGTNSSIGQYQINLEKFSLAELGITQTGVYTIQLCGGNVCGNALQLPVQGSTTQPVSARSIRTR